MAVSWHFSRILWTEFSRILWTEDPGRLKQLSISTGIFSYLKNTHPAFRKYFIVGNFFPINYLTSFLLEHFNVVKARFIRLREMKLISLNHLNKTG